MPDFKIVSDFRPTGDQPDAIDRLVRGAENELHHQSLMGVTGSGKTFTMACIVERSSALPSFSRTTRPLRPSLPPSSRSSSPTTPSSTSSATTTTTSPRRTFPAPTRTSRRRRHQRAARQAASRRHTCAPDPAGRAHRRLGIVHLRSRLSRGVPELRRVRQKRRDTQPAAAHAPARGHAVRPQRLRPRSGPLPGSG